MSEVPPLVEEILDIEVELEQDVTETQAYDGPWQIGTVVFSDFQPVIMTHICPTCQTEIETIGHAFPKLLCAHCRFPMATKTKSG